MNYPESGIMPLGGGIISRCHHIHSRHEAATKICNRVVVIRIIHYLCSYTPSGNAPFLTMKRQQDGERQDNTKPHNESAAPESAAADRIRRGEGELQTADAGHGTPATHPQRRRMASREDRQELLQLAQPAGYRGVSHCRRRHRTQFRIRKTRVLLPYRRGGRQRGDSRQAAHRQDTGQRHGKGFRPDCHRNRELCRHRPHGGGDSRQDRTRRDTAEHGECGCAAILRRDQLQTDVRSPRPRDTRQRQPAGIPARPVLFKAESADILVRRDKIPMAQHGTGTRREQCVEGKGRGGGTRSAGNRKDHHARRGDIRNAEAGEPGAGVRTEQHGSGLDIRKARRPRSGGATHRKPHTSERQDALLHLRAALRVASRLSRTMEHPQGDTPAAAEPQTRGCRQLAPEGGTPEEPRHRDRMPNQRPALRRGACDSLNSRRQRQPRVVWTEIHHTIHRRGSTGT